MAETETIHTCQNNAKKCITFVPKLQVFTIQIKICEVSSNPVRNFFLVFKRILAAGNQISLMNARSIQIITYFFCIFTESISSILNVRFFKTSSTFSLQKNQWDIYFSGYFKAKSSFYPRAQTFIFHSTMIILRFSQKYYSGKNTYVTTFMEEMIYFSVSTKCWIL